MAKSKVRGRKSSKLVIDAGVVQASGGAAATDLRSTACRDFLQRMLEVCHKAVLNPKLREEWKRHASKFAFTWWSNMEARKKIVRFPSDDLDAMIDQFVDAAATERHKEIVEDDAHLIHAAANGDGIVVSLDDKAKEAFGVASKRVESLREIRWIVPNVDPAGNLAALHANDFGQVGSLLGS